MAEEGEKKRISSNPFLYTDGSLVGSDDELEEDNGGDGDILDPDQTPQAEVPVRQVWTVGRAAPRCVSMDIDDEKLQTMTGSYSEILARPMLRQGIAEEEEQVEDKDEIDAVTPVCAEMDPVQAFLTQERLKSFMAQDDSQGDAPEYHAHLPRHPQERPWSLEVGECSTGGGAAETALQAAGTVTRQGDIISFVADDLHNKIKLASPVSKSVGILPGSRSSTPSLLRATLEPQLLPIDPTVINDIERHARHIATSVDTLIENLTGTLHSISSLTVDCVETYRDAVCKTCDAVDANIKSMYQLMAKTEELSKSMKPIYKLQDQIKDIRRLLDIYENIHTSGS